MRIFVVMCFISALVSGCAATGQKYSEKLNATNVQTASSARLVVLRTRESSQYSARSVSVKVDGQSVGSCDYAGFNIFDVSVGKHSLIVDMWDSPGTCELPIDLAGGNEYFFEIKPRSGNLVGMLLGGIIGAAIETSGKQCGGAFAVEPISKDLAVPKLADLRMTN
jgi:hypothetical protein